jgi:hypothetical protein
MTTTNNHIEISEELVEVTGGGLRIAELAILGLFGLILCPPLLILAVIVAVPAIAIGAVVAAVFAAIAGPAYLIGRARAHHRAHHGATLVLHRLLPRRA